MTNSTSGTPIDRKALERILDHVLLGKMTLEAFSDWILKVLIAEELEVAEEDNALVWMVVYWLSDCIEEGDACDLLTWVQRYREALAAASASENVETLLWIAGARDVLIDYLGKVTQGTMTREEYNAAISKRELWPLEVRQLLHSLPNRDPLNLISAFEEEDYHKIAGLLKLQ